MCGAKAGDNQLARPHRPGNSIEQRLAFAGQQDVHLFGTAVEVLTAESAGWIEGP
nr:hypothetical protein [Streptomyces sp. TRM70350]